MPVALTLTDSLPVAPPAKMISRPELKVCVAAVATILPPEAANWMSPLQQNVLKVCPGDASVARPVTRRLLLAWKVANR